VASSGARYILKSAFALTLTGFLFPWGVVAQERPSCFMGLSYALTDEGTYLYNDDSPGEPSSDGRLELVRDGQTVWSVSAERGCSMGISICQLSMDYTLDDGTPGSIDFDMSFGEVTAESGETVCVTAISQMGENLAYLHRRHSDQAVTFAAGRTDAPVLGMDTDLKGIPSVFQQCSCGQTQNS